MAVLVHVSLGALISWMVHIVTTCETVQEVVVKLLLVGVRGPSTSSNLLLLLFTCPAVVRSPPLHMVCWLPPSLLGVVVREVRVGALVFLMPS